MVQMIRYTAVLLLAISLAAPALAAKDDGKKAGASDSQPAETVVPKAKVTPGVTPSQAPNPQIRE